MASKFKIILFLYIFVLCSCDEYKDAWDYPPNEFPEMVLLDINISGINQVSVSVILNNSENISINEYGFCYALDNSTPNKDDFYVKASEIEENIFRGNLTDLQPFSGYFIRPCITLNNGLVIFGDVISIFTSNIQIATDKFIQTNFTQKSVVLSGIINGIPKNADQSLINSFGFCISPLDTPFVSGPETICFAFDGEEAKNGIFSHQFEDLITGKLYYANSFIRINEVITYGNTCTFILESCWQQKKDLPDLGRGFAVGFEIKGKGYYGTGISRDIFGNNTIYQDWWEYDPAMNEWDRKADFPGGPRAFTTGFSIGDKGYVGLGTYASGTDSIVFHDDFWEYDTDNDVWNKMENFKGGKIQGAFGFSLKEKGYVGSGERLIPEIISINLGEYVNDFWEFDPTVPVGEGQWRRLADFEGTPRLYANAFRINSKGYIATGLTEFNLGETFFEISFNGTQDVWEYDPVLDQWTRKADFPGGNRSFIAGFAIGNKAYLGTGATDNLRGLLDFWEYDSILDQWRPVCDLVVQNGRAFAQGFSIGNKGYLGFGFEEGTFTWRQDFWAFTPQN